MAHFCIINVETIINGPTVTIHLSVLTGKFLSQTKRILLIGNKLSENGVDTQTFDIESAILLTAGTKETTDLSSSFSQVTFTPDSIKVKMLREQVLIPLLPEVNGIREVDIEVINKSRSERITNSVLIRIPTPSKLGR